MLTPVQLSLLENSRVKGYSNPDSIVLKAQEVIPQYAEVLDCDIESASELVVDNPFLIAYNPQARFSELLDRYGRGRRLPLQRVFLGSEGKKGFPNFITYAHRNALQRKAKLVEQFGMSKSELKDYILERNPRMISHGENRDLAVQEIVEKLRNGGMDLSLEMLLANLPKSPYVKVDGENLRLSELEQLEIDKVPDLYTTLVQRINNQNRDKVDRYAA